MESYCYIVIIDHVIISSSHSLLQMAFCSILHDMCGRFEAARHKAEAMLGVRAGSLPPDVDIVACFQYQFVARSMNYLFFCMRGERATMVGNGIIDAPRFEAIEGQEKALKQLKVLLFKTGQNVPAHVRTAAKDAATADLTAGEIGRAHVCTPVTL